MRKELVKNKDGSSYYSFVYYNSYDQGRIRLSKAYIAERFGKNITDANEADAVLAILEKEFVTLSNKVAARLPEGAYKFKPLLDMYTELQCKAAPNSYQNNLHYLKYYVLHFFLAVKNCENLNAWYEHYDDFRDWLETDAYLIRDPSQLISYSSKNHSVRALNTFMAHMARKRYVEVYRSCTQFPSYKVKEKTADDLVSAEELEMVCQKLRVNGHQTEALFFRLLYFTGMRFNEACGLSLADLFEGTIEDHSFHVRLEQHRIGYMGYLVIDSQPARRRRLKDLDGSVPRKPLKGRKRIDEKSARLIPIIDAVLWKELAETFNESLKQYKDKLWGDNLKDYLLFETIHTTSGTYLRQAYEALGLSYRTWHCLRHTRATLLVGQTGDFVLTRFWLGHKSQAVLDRYTHIYQASVRQAKKGRQLDPKPIRTE